MLGLAVLVALASPGTALPPGTVTTAKVGADALFIWNASPVIADIVKNETPDAPAVASLEAGAADVLVAEAAQQSRAKTLTVKVVYPKTAFGPPRYGTTTAELDEVVMTVEASRADIVRSGKSWRAAIVGGTVPHAVTVKLVGALPAEH